MKKYFSCVPCSDGFCCAFNSIYKNDPTARVFIVYDGDDSEKAIFFDELVKRFIGYDVTEFIPFYDSRPDGIYIKDINTYILSDGGFNRMSAVLPNETEKFISISYNKNYDARLKRDIFVSVRDENAFYKSGCNLLKEAARVKKQIHAKASLFTDDKKIVNFIKRFYFRTLCDNVPVSAYQIRMMSSITPLGFKTNYDTIFSLCKSIVNFCDNDGFIGSVILNVIKALAIKNKLPLIISPTYYDRNIPQFLIFPSLSLALVHSDNNHILPFDSSHQVNCERFILKGTGYDKNEFESLLNAENQLLSKGVLSFYNGRDLRYARNYSIRGYTDLSYAKKQGKRLADILLNE